MCALGIYGPLAKSISRILSARNCGALPHAALECLRRCHAGRCQARRHGTKVGSLRKIILALFDALCNRFLTKPAPATVAIWH